MSLITIRPGVAFRPDAAASFRRVERDAGRQVDVNRTTSSFAVQDDLYKRRQAGQYPYPVADPRYSNHVYRSDTDGGNAWDTDERGTWLDEHGWLATVRTEPWHREYHPDRDKHRNDPAPAGHTIPTTEEDEEDDMASLNGATYVRAADKATVCILFNEASGFYVEHTGVGGGYNNPIAENWGTGTWPPITESHATVIKRALDGIRRTTVAGSLSVDIDEQ